MLAYKPDHFKISIKELIPKVKYLNHQAAQQKFIQSSMFYWSISFSSFFYLVYVLYYHNLEKLIFDKYGICPSNSKKTVLRQFLNREEFAFQIQKTFRT